jgi:hypothetical protein
MIHITYRRVGPVVMAITVNDNYEVITAIGLTSQHAMRRLIGRLTNGPRS